MQGYGQDLNALLGRRIKFDKMPAVAHDGRVIGGDKGNVESVDCNGCGSSCRRARC